MSIHTPARSRFGLVSPRSRFGVVCAAAVLFGMSLPARAAEKIDAAAMARSVAPFVDSETILVAHLDPSRVSVRPIVDTITRLGGSGFGLDEAEKGIAECQETLRRERVAELYFVVSLGGTSLIPRMTLVVSPAEPKRDLAALRTGLRLPAQVRLAVANLPSPAAGPPARPELADALEAAGDAAVQIALIPPASSRRVIEEIMPQLPPQIGGGPSTLVTHGVSWAALAIDLSPTPAVRLTIRSQDAAAAEALRAKWADVLKIAGQQKEVQEALPEFSKSAADLIPKLSEYRPASTDGERHLSEYRLTLTVDEKDVVGAGRMLERATANALSATWRMQSMHNLREIALGMLNYSSTFKNRFPPAASHTPDGRPLLSWRVAILPFMEQDQLYKQFHLDEPWDSPHNKALIEKMPAVFRSPKSKAARGMTNYVVPVGGGALYASPTEEADLRDIKDGTSHTIMLMEVDDQHAVVWTKPDDLDFDPSDPKKGIGNLYAEGFNVAFCDGSVFFIRRTIDQKTIKALITRAGGENVEMP